MYMRPYCQVTVVRLRFSGQLSTGDKVSGVTTMQMNEGLDTGDMIMKTEVPLAEDETGGSLHDKLAKAGAKALC